MGYKGLWLQLLSIENSMSEPNTCIKVSELLPNYSKVFDEPSGSPPQRSRDHQILLKESLLVSVRPYRYSYYQKIEIEKTVSELLKSDVIRPS